jgi:50S ribosomal subunit-associated GTPase HflX
VAALIVRLKKASLVKVSPAFSAMKRARCLVCALVSARLPEPEQILDKMEAAVKSVGGTAVGRLLQRRGVSRSKSPGGAAKMEQPLTQRSLFGSGKLEELAAMAISSDVDVLLVHNSLTNRQRNSLAELTGCRVFSFLDDVAPHLHPA